MSNGYPLGALDKLARGSTSPVDPHIMETETMPEIRTSRLSVRARPDELDRWQVVARRAGHHTTAGWIRALLRDAEFAGQEGDQLLAELRGLRGDLARVGNNLNQLAHAANRGEAVACAATLDDIDVLKDRTDRLLNRIRPASRQTIH
ncbi:plasmid mobilization relaxosome protein MobC [Acetobacter lambici]|uniref:MobC family plasmid mobilization relaxosome protein n=1 Tax=Acetobacter lambici TaxID=1332824 RepID=A0ABT1F1B5_9PROT|nr:MobC family plasmid mobilization relaxosome protein [Acetobacter lambici]MCP1258781.1 MobC family plasmid mobilization relaxosome protein [Acetobacter lambici]NHO56990.1 plasmid mobilization relaxosome protein MobC [Acetobacter lambici]